MPETSATRTQNITLTKPSDVTTLSSPATHTPTIWLQNATTALSDIANQQTQTDQILPLIVVLSCIFGAALYFLLKTFAYFLPPTYNSLTRRAKFNALTIFFGILRLILGLFDFATPFNEENPAKLVLFSMTNILAFVSSDTALFIRAFPLAKSRILCLATYSFTLVTKITLFILVDEPRLMALQLYLVTITNRQKIFNAFYDVATSAYYIYVSYVFIQNLRDRGLLGAGHVYGPSKNKREKLQRLQDFIRRYGIGWMAIVAFCRFMRIVLSEGTFSVFFGQVAVVCEVLIVPGMVRKDTIQRYCTRMGKSLLGMGGNNTELKINGMPNSNINFSGRVVNNNNNNNNNNDNNNGCGNNAEDTLAAEDYNETLELGNRSNNLISRVTNNDLVLIREASWVNSMISSIWSEGDSKVTSISTSFTGPAIDFTSPDPFLLPSHPPTSAISTAASSPTLPPMQTAELGISTRNSLLLPVLLPKIDIGEPLTFNDISSFPVNSNINS